VLDRAGCGELVVAADKDDDLYAWHADDVGALAQRLTVTWPKLTVSATDFFPNPAGAAAWVSPDGGGTWSLG
jgi:hypothetical protein